MHHLNALELFFFRTYIYIYIFFCCVVVELLELQLFNRFFGTFSELQFLGMFLPTDWTPYVCNAIVMVSIFNTCSMVCKPWGVDAMWVQWRMITFIELAHMAVP